MRKFQRYSVRLKIYNEESGTLIGYAEDISIYGINIRSVKPFPDGKEVNIWFGTTEHNRKEDKISLTVFKIWGAFPDTLPRLYSTGLHFVMPSEDALDAIQNLIGDLTEHSA
ncbi:MAG: hypothetical protein ACI9XC_002214 [Gammaproteobacteria bacterium]|jgi:hypothetical protein